MKLLALINQAPNLPYSQWQFDRILACIAFDFEISIVFSDMGIRHLSEFKAYKSLSIYGMTDIHYLKSSSINTNDFLIQCKKINTYNLKKMILKADVLI